MKTHPSWFLQGACLPALLFLLGHFAQAQTPAGETIASRPETSSPGPLAAIRGETTAHRAAARFRRGVNLGNYLEAPRGQDWGARYTAQDFVWIKQEGFDHVRLPIAWHHYAGPGPEFVLADEIYAQADFLVTNALQNGLSVLLNIHHFDEFTSDPPAHTNKFLALWRQIAARYQSMPPQVSFELLNEPKDAATTVVMNPIYAQAIQEIRRTNPDRTLFVGPGKWNRVTELTNLALPVAEQNLIVTVHCYEPYYFTHQGATWGGPDTKLTGIQFPGPPATPLVPDPALSLRKGVLDWLERYNTLPADQNPSGPAEIRKHIGLAKAWAERSGRPVHLGEFGCYIQADAASRQRFYAEFRRLAADAGLGWAVWDWKAGFRYWDDQRRQPVAGMREALFSPSSPAPAPASTVAWPEWRGPNGQGHATTMGLPLHWSESSNITWKVSIPGRAWSSPVIEGPKIWLTTAVETRARPEDAERRLKANTGNQPLTVLEKVDLRALCLDRATGRVLHDVLVLSVQEPQWVHELNSYASPTPVLERGRLYCHFGDFGNACVDTDAAKVVWTNTSLRLMHENGPGSSPVLWRDLLIFHLDGSDTQSIAALDKHTGQLAWRTTRSGKMSANPQFKKAYATPSIVRVDGEDQILSQGADWLYAYAPASGSELWKLNYQHMGYSQSARAVAGHGMLFLSTGYNQAQMLAVRYPRSGGPEPEVVWRYTKGVPTMPSPVLVDEELYFVNDSAGFLTCLEAKTGKEYYRERLGGNYSASPLHADGRLYVSSREGVTAVVATGQKFTLLAKNELPGKIMASPAAVDGALFLRTDKALYRIEQMENRK